LLRRRGGPRLKCTAARGCVCLARCRGADAASGQYLGVYRMEVDAAAAYDAASWFVLGTKAVVNFPDTDFDHVDVPRAPPQWLVDALLGGVRCGFGARELDEKLTRAGGRRQARNGKAALSPLFKRWQERDAAR